MIVSLANTHNRMETLLFYHKAFYEYISRDASFNVISPPL